MNPIAASVARPYTVAVGVILVGIASWLAVARIPVRTVGQSAQQVRRAGEDRIRVS